jgi:hypothetical protein
MMSKNGHTETRTTRSTTSILRMCVRIRAVRVVEAETRVGVLVCHVFCNVIGCGAVSVACHVRRQGSINSCEIFS